MEGILCWLAGLVHTSGSDDGAGLNQILLIVAQATSTELELSVYLLWLVQETQFKLSTGSPHYDKQDLIETSVIVGPTSAYQARKPS